MNVKEVAPQNVCFQSRIEMETGHSGRSDTVLQVDTDSEEDVWLLLEKKQRQRHYTILCCRLSIVKGNLKCNEKLT